MRSSPQSHSSGYGSSAYNQTPPVDPSLANTPPDPESPGVKITRGHSCLLCQQRKVRCNKNKPCSNCVKAGVECRPAPYAPPRRKLKVVHERELLDRLHRYEALLSRHGIAFDPLGPNIKITGLGSVEEGDELDPNFIKRRANAATSGADPDVISSAGENHHIPRALTWFPHQKEFRQPEDHVKDSSEEEDVGSTINHAYDKMFDHSNGFPFAIGGQYESVTHLHPPPYHIFQLWQIYLDNVNPLLKLTHTPSLQQQIVEAGTNLRKVSKSLEALMFTIYLMAITSLDDNEVVGTFLEPRQSLIDKYQHAAQQALFNAGFMRMPDLTVLQAYLLYCLGVRHHTDPRSLFCLTGLGVRLAHRLGLQRDGAEFGFSPFEVEERRRLWWNLAGFDRRIGEMCGSTITAVSTGGNCKLPLNINDVDLHVHAKALPAASRGATEMIFSLTRLEFAKGPGHDKMKPILSAANPLAVTNLANQREPRYLGQFARYMEETYLNFCDPKIPIHYMTLLMTRATMCKLRIISSFFRVALMAPAILPAAESETIFIDAIQMIEYDSMMQAHERLKGYLWYTKMHFPLPAYVWLLSELRNRTTGDLCERAWETLLEHAERRNLTTQTNTPLHLAFSGLFVKAWEAREAAEAANGRVLAPPKLIIVMRNIDSQMPKKSKDKAPHSTLSPQFPTPSSLPNSTANVMPNPAVYNVPPDKLAGNMQYGDMNRHLFAAFPDFNFGGELDFNYLLQEYGGYMPPQDFGGSGEKSPHPGWQ